MYTIATLHHLRQRLGLGDGDTAEDVRLLAALEAASAQIEAAANRRFQPRRATIRHSVNPRYPTELLLDDDLLELVALTNGDGSSLDLSAVLTLPEGTPDGIISLLQLTGGAAFVWGDTPMSAVSVAGVWGWHERWSQAWYASGDTVQNTPLGSSSATLTVNDAGGSDAQGEAPRFQVGHLLRIEDEYLHVLAVNTDSNSLTVLRGVNGTTAAVHEQGAAVEIYQPPLDVEMLCLRWAQWLYKEPDNRAFSAAPSSLTGALAGLRREGVSS